jgi:ankyrin repeat protein
MLDLEEEDYSDKKEINLDKLLPDCSTNTCDNTEILLSLDPDYKKNKEASATEDYYLISAVKDDNVEYLKSHHIKGNSVNKKLLYGYEGNTIFHHAIYYNSLKCIEYLLTTDYNYSIVNKDLNSVLHIACLKGNYDATFKLLKHGANVICKNKYGDTALHSAVRSGSYNCVKILIENNGESCLIIKNKYGETPYLFLMMRQLSPLFSIKILTQLYEPDLTALCNAVSPYLFLHITFAPCFNNLKVAS